MVDSNTKIRITWPGSCEEGEEEAKGKEREDGGCCHLYRSECCAGLRACCVNCWEAMGDIPRCTCFYVRSGCARAGRCGGGCLRLCGGVFSAVVSLAGCLGLVLVVMFLWQAIFHSDTPASKSS